MNLEKTVIHTSMAVAPLDVLLVVLLAVLLYRIARLASGPLRHRRMSIPTRTLPEQMRLSGR